MSRSSTQCGRERTSTRNRRSASPRLARSLSAAGPRRRKYAHGIGRWTAERYSRTCAARISGRTAPCDQGAVASDAAGVGGGNADFADRAPAAQLRGIAAGNAGALAECEAASRAGIRHAGARVADLSGRAGHVLASRTQTIARYVYADACILTHLRWSARAPRPSYSLASTGRLVPGVKTRVKPPCLDLSLRESYI